MINIDTGNFFRKYQKELLEVANSWYGRQSLQIPSTRKIIRIARNSVSLKLNKKTTQSIYYPADVYVWRILTGHRNNPQDKSILEYLAKKNLHSDPYNDLDDIKFGFLQGMRLKGVNPAMLRFATDTFNASAGDGSCYDQDGTFATARGNTVAEAAESVATETYLAFYITGGTYHVRRTFFPCDTSGNPIPESDSISAASLNVYNNTTENNNADGQSIVLCQMTGATPLVVGDFDGYDSLGSPVEWSARKTYASFNIDAYNAIDFLEAQFSQITRNGVTSIGIRDTDDIDNNAPVGINSKSLVTSEAVSNKPYLSVTHASAAKPSFRPNKLRPNIFAPGLAR